MVSTDSHKGTGAGSTVHQVGGLSVFPRESRLFFKNSCVSNMKLNTKTFMSPMSRANLAEAES